MRPSLSLTEVYLYRQPVDFRKSHRGLSAIVECELEHNPFEGCLYAFTNKARNKIKCCFKKRFFPYSREEKTSGARR
ncbi:MAG: IS66 family insertion sequence element accessory protein TnpB [Candidatus Methanofishera endochildressiae]|uniref:IS66 family insertion sequence element accessory protein TnpB n=1 Tax=Candidatus Methanofishera endochildressiae TaxID=2738884 RepID=A0A7Z0MP84_9GAMM|nr:IS66 family insertion sequence element accessory protein TnpB [Candidatus Methanofishera endochildressiae]